MNKRENLKLHILALSLLYTLNVSATQTSTNVLFEDPYTQGKSTNEYGDKISYQKVKLQTKNFKVNNFWSNFHADKNNQDNYANIATTAIVKLTTELSFTCKDGGLDTEGCSGQKPFFINVNTLTNPDMKLDRLGAPLPEGEFRIPFDKALNYTSARDDAFYSLDVFRDGQYYKAPQTPLPKDSPKNFFAYIKSFLSDFFSKDTATTYSQTMTTHEQEVRGRYVANITFGLQKTYRAKRNSTIHTNEINTANDKKRISQIDYAETAITTTSGCNGLFLNYDPDSIVCKGVSFFGLANWMPFFNNGEETEYKTTALLEDTEVTLLTLAGKNDGINYVKQKATVDTAGGTKSFASEIFKPVSFMAGSVLRFLFGENSKTLTEVVSAEFDFTNPLPLTFFEVNNDTISEFRHFALLGLESIYGTEVESCKVKQTKSFFFFPIGWDTKLFTKGVDTTTKFDMEAGMFGSFLNNSSQYSELNYKEEKHRKIGDWGNHDVVSLSTDDWLDWCKRNQGRQSKGLFGRVLDTFTSFILANNRNLSYDQQIDKLLRDDDWSVVEYKEKVHKALILHLKVLELNNISVGAKGTTTEFKMMKTMRGNK
jgi:hypothetical protein